jgi:RimJ/RimL family protein N-acetyltransferase
MYDNNIMFEPCKKIKEHARQIMMWRNDPTTLSMSYHQEPKIWKDFWSEYLDTYFLYAPEIYPLFAVSNGKKIGFLKFSPVNHPKDLSKLTVDISINLSPEIRGRGFGSKILTACRYFLKERGVQSIYAEVLSHNTVSIKVFQSAGFLLIEQKNKIIDEKREYNICCFIIDDL